MNKGQSRRENSRLLGDLAKSGKEVSLIVIGHRPIRGCRVNYQHNDSSCTPGNANYYLVSKDGRRVRHLYASDIIPGVHGDGLAISVMGIDSSYRKDKRID
jgi:hypothetical protein